MGIESYGPARFQPYTITTGTGGAYASKDADGNNIFGSGLNPALGGVSNQATEGAGNSQTALQNALTNNQGGFNSPQFQSQYQGLGGGQPQQNYPMARNMGPDNAGGFGQQIGGSYPTGGFKGPERPIQGGPPQLDPGFGYSEDAGLMQQQPMPQQQQQTNGPQGNNFTPEAFDINKATNDYFQQGMNVLNPQFQQQNANLAQSLQGSGRGGLQLASGSMGAGAGGMMNPDAYQTGNAQSNALANLYQQSRGSALGEQNQMYGQGLTTEQQRMAGLGQLYGQDAATAQQNYNQSLGAFGANQNQMLNYSDLNQSQMANLGMFSGMENDLTKLGLTAEQMRAAAAKGSYYTPDIRESSGSKLMGSIMGGIGSKIGAGIVMCFGKGTQFLMGDGSYKVVEDIQIGEDIHGGTVLKTHTAPSSSAFYDYNGTVVTYDHLVLEDGTWKYVEDANEAVKTEDRDVIYTLDTSNHRLYGINGSVFTDEAVFDDDHPLKDPDLPYDHSTWDEMLIVLNKEEA